MKFLWVNNVPSILGGTLNCTHSMCKALPNHDHMVLSLQGEFRSAEREAFKDVATLVTEREDADVVVFQNNPIALVGSFGNVRRKSRLVYYHHSAHGASPLLTDHQFFVSDYLKSKVGLPGEVLYQPVTRPKERFQRHKKGVVIGRLCTPTKEKWVLDEFLPHLVACKNIPGVWFDLVGCPEAIKSTVQTSLDHKVSFFPCSFSARSLFHTWGCMVYTASQHETFGRTVREAQRCGCVPIVSNHSGLAEQVRDGHGFAVSSPQDVYNAVIRSKEDPSLKSRCRDYGDQMGSLENWAKKFEAAIGVV